MQKHASSVTGNLLLERGGARHDSADPRHPLLERRCFAQGKPSGD
jgi:hypothetical protein